MTIRSLPLWVLLAVSLSTTAQTPPPPAAGRPVFNQYWVEAARTPGRTMTGFLMGRPGQVNKAEMWPVVRDRFDAFLDANGIDDPTQLTRMMLEGRFNPHFQDLDLYYQALVPPGSLAAPRNKPLDYTRARDRAWNQRFGAITDLPDTTASHLEIEGKTRPFSLTHQDLALRFLAFRRDKPLGRATDRLWILSQARYAIIRERLRTVDAEPVEQLVASALSENPPFSSFRYFATELGQAHYQTLRDTVFLPAVEARRRAPIVGFEPLDRLAQQLEPRRLLPYADTPLAQQAYRLAETSSGVAALGLKTDARRGDATAQALLAMGHQHAALATPSTNRPAPRPGALNAAAFGLPADTQPAWSQLQKALRHHRIKPDLEAGRALARAAADAGSPTGMTVYSDYLDQGLGGPQDRNAAMQWREKAIAAGSILAVFRNEARQLEQNPDHPLDTLEQLADTGHATAAAALADHWRARITYGSVVPGSRKDPFTKSIERLVQAASAGHPESIVRVLRRVKANAKTPGLDRDQLPALARHATELGHPQAADLMAQILAQHEAPRRDRLNWYRLAVAGGYEPAYAKAADVALATEESPAQLIDGPTAAWLYAKSAQSGDTGSLINLADMLGIGKALPRDTPTALALLREAARRGSLDAANALGRLAGGFRENWDVPPDPDQYRHWLGIEADLGNADAAVVLGSNYEDGDLWPADAAQALYHYAMAADLGQPLGAEAVAYAYFRELHGLPKDPAEIITWAARAGEAGNLDAISLFCGSFLNEAVIVTLSIQVGKLDEMEDPLIAPDQLSRALHWVRWAADQEHAESAYILAETYRHGIPKPDLKNFSIKPDTRKAIRWYEQAVEYGHEDAPAIMYDIAKLYHEQGRIPQSGQWMKRALEAGSEEAIEEQLLKEQAAAGDVDAMRKLGRHEQADAVEARRAEAAKPLTTKQQREAARLAWRAYFQKRGKAAFDAGELNHQQWHRYVVEALQHGDAIYDQPGNPYDLEDTETLETEHQRFLKRAKQTP